MSNRILLALISLCSILLACKYLNPYSVKYIIAPIWRSVIEVTFISSAIEPPCMYSYLLFKEYW
jgi:hypothetical protein